MDGFTNFVRRHKVGTAIALALVLVLVAGGVYAAWSQTRSMSTTAVVRGTFTVQNLDCPDTITGEWATCTGQITNQFNAPISIDAAEMTSTSQPAIAITPVLLNGGSLATPLAPGATGNLTADWRPLASGGLPAGTVVPFVMTVTASD